MEIFNEQFDFNNKDKDLYLLFEMDGLLVICVCKNILEIFIKFFICE